MKFYAHALFSIARERERLKWEALEHWRSGDADWARWQTDLRDVLARIAMGMKGETL